MNGKQLNPLNLKPTSMHLPKNPAGVSASLQVSADLQQEVLMTLIQTDPDIIDYLLRRKLR